MSPVIAYRPMPVSVRARAAALAARLWRVDGAEKAREHLSLSIWEGEGGSLASEWMRFFPMNL